MFRGSYEHRLDSKGRLILPAAFREHLSEGLVLTKGYDRCIDVWTPDAYERRVEALRALPREEKLNRALRIFVTSSAFEQTPDSQNRIVVPAGLREYAGLTRDLMVAGDDDKVVIWDREAWHDFMGQYEDEIANIDGIVGTTGPAPSHVLTP